jgi:CheY-like chemotaxis protein
MLGVSDTGMGMTPDALEHIYEPFFTTKAHGRGTGLGLATVYGIIRQSGGAIECDSKTGQGTCFTAYFPVSDETPRPEAISSDVEEVVGGSETILVVEDNEPVRGFVEDSLSRLGYRVIAAAGGEEALVVSSATEEKIQLLLTDVILPGINGRELARRIRFQRPGIRVLYTSGYAGDVLTRSGVIEERLNFISKPFSVLAIARKVRQVLDEVGAPAGSITPPAENT